MGTYEEDREIARRVLGAAESPWYMLHNLEALAWCLYVNPGASRRFHRHAEFLSEELERRGY